jgi:GntR family transcriptional regulator
LARHRHESQHAIPLPDELSLDRGKGEQLHELLEAYIAKLRPGDLLPSERVLAERLGVARMTVRQEFERLTVQGLVRRQHGQGTFVAEPKLVQTDHVSSFSEDMWARGKTPGSRVISVRVQTADPVSAMRLQLRPEAEVVNIVRVRTGDGEPIALERTNLPADRFPGLEHADLSNASLYELVERRWHVRIDRAEQRISAVLPDAEDARLLEMSPKLPAFLIERVTRDADGGVIEFGRSLYRGDRYDVLMNVSRVPN